MSNEKSRLMPVFFSPYYQDHDNVNSIIASAAFSLTSLREGTTKQSHVAFFTVIARRYDEVKRHCEQREAISQIQIPTALLKITSCLAIWKVIASVAWQSNRY